MSIKIGEHIVGRDQPPFIVAEMSANHNGSLERALKLVDEIKKAGAHAIKLQTYTPDTMTLDISDREFVIKDKTSLWVGQTLYNLYKEAHTPWEWHKPIIERCKKLNLPVFSTPFDVTAVDFLETFDVPCYKIASLEITDHPLIQRAARTGKPVIISTGASTIEEIREAIEAAKKAGCKQLILLKCTSSYPADACDVNLKTIPYLAEEFHLPVGLSDHTLGIGSSIASVALGSVLIEKHVTLSRTDGGFDAPFSLEPHELKMLVYESKRAWESLGSVQCGPLPSEQSSLKLRRSLYFVKDIKAGDIITSGHIRAIRPGLGLPPKEIEKVLGKKMKTSAKRGEPVRWELIQ